MQYKHYVGLLESDILASIQLTDNEAKIYAFNNESRSKIRHSFWEIEKNEFKLELDDFLNAILYTDLDMKDVWFTYQSSKMIDYTDVPSEIMQEYENRLPDETTWNKPIVIIFKKD